MKIIKLYKEHLRYCKDYWKTPVSRTTFYHRLERWWTDWQAVLKANSWHWGARKREFSVKDLWRNDPILCEFTYSSYLKYYKKNTLSIFTERCITRKRTKDIIKNIKKK